MEDIRLVYPPGLGGRINKYAEPFAGGGAVLFDILNRFALDEAYISDSNGDLINAYIAVRDNVDTLTGALRGLEKQYLAAGREKRREIYYEKRDEFNGLKTGNGMTAEAAALFLFLNRTCYNGLYRVNSKGLFNVPQGEYKNPRICDGENLRAVSEKLRNVTVVHGDYRLAGNFIDDRTFAYFDPPYRPLSATSNFTSYTQAGFDDRSQEELARFIGEMSGRGAFIAVSNSDPANTDGSGRFFEELYAGYSIRRIKAARAINASAAGRGRIRELLITNGR